MQAHKWIWLVWLLMVVSYVVPYTILSDVQAWYGSFLLWVVVGGLVIVLNVVITRDLKEP